MIVEEIVNYLDESGIESKLLCRRAGFEENYIDLAASGKRNLEIEEYVKICNLLNKGYDYFFERRNSALKRNGRKVNGDN